jgi:ArsR family transcriptional regulator
MIWPEPGPGGFEVAVPLRGTAGQVAAALPWRARRYLLSNTSLAGVRLRLSPLPSTPLKVSAGTIARLSEVFSILADESRLKIVLALAQDGDLHVSALCDLLGQSQPAVSHHLTLMRRAGLVEFTRVGKHNFYRLISTTVRDLFEQFFSDAGNGHKQLQFPDFVLSYRGR